MQEDNPQTSEGHSRDSEKSVEENHSEYENDYKIQESYSERAKKNPNLAGSSLNSEKAPVSAETQSKGC